MKRMKFNSQGKLIGADLDGFTIGQEAKNNNNNYQNSLEDNEIYSGKLRTSKDLDYLKEDKDITFSQVIDNSTWSLYENNQPLKPLMFSNGRTQEDIVNQIVSSIKSGKKIILLHGVCGTGKSAIALNIARQLGKASIVVPVKGLQRQYEEDYTTKKYLIKPNGKKMKIAMITGRENHDSVIQPGVSCADPFLPDTIKITDKNFQKLKEYYSKNPLANTKEMPEIKMLKRISIAPSNPYWSPIVPSTFDLQLKDAKKKKYLGLEGKEFTFYHRKQGCSYYDQYQSYIDADVIIFNSAKYKIDTLLDKKPETKVDIIDEADEFLDNFSTQEELNLSRLYSSLQHLNPESPATRELIEQIKGFIELEEKNKSALGIDESQLFELKDTKLDKVLKLFLKSPELETEIYLDEDSYANKALEISYMFKDFFDETFVSFRKYENALMASLVSTNLSKKFQEIVRKNKALVLMSGTLHSPIVMKEIFGVQDFEIIEAETLNQGTIEIIRTGKEFDCKYDNFKSGRHTKEQYLQALSSCMEKSKKPVLIHVNSFEDLPSEQEKMQLGITNLTSKERLKQLQMEDKTGRLISLFKSKMNDSLFTTKCSRGVDFPGDTCNSIIFTKYPNPNVQGTFWKILERTHQKYYWDFYRDKARREFLQRIYRALRSKDDHVFILSPDIRVLDAVRELQMHNE
jgi:Rad3-related DNA helicase